MVGEDRNELAYVLRRLAEWDIREESELALWYDVARAVNEWLAAPRSVSVPRELWAWLAEADRRFTDPEVARAQDAFIWDYIRELESR